MTTINERLSSYYKDESKIFLEEGVAHKTAESLSKVKTHQLRKYLDKIKEAKEVSVNDLQKAKNILYSLVPLAAYNVGRDQSQREIYNFVKDHIKVNTIVEQEDIEVLDKLYTSVIAYHKLISGIKTDQKFHKSNNNSGGKR